MQSAMSTLSSSEVNQVNLTIDSTVNLHTRGTVCDLYYYMNSFVTINRLERIVLVFVFFSFFNRTLIYSCGQSYPIFGQYLL